MAKKNSAQTQAADDVPVAMEDVTVYTDFEVKAHVVSAPSGELLSSSVHDLVVKLNSEGSHVIANSIIQPHLYEGNDHRSVVTYLKAPYTEKHPVSQK